MYKQQVFGSSSAAPIAEKSSGDALSTKPEVQPSAENPGILKLDIAARVFKPKVKPIEQTMNSAPQPVVQAPVPNVPLPQ
jgi:hypothetical protein